MRRSFVGTLSGLAEDLLLWKRCAVAIWGKCCGSDGIRLRFRISVYKPGASAFGNYLRQDGKDGHSMLGSTQYSLAVWHHIDIRQ